MITFSNLGRRGMNLGNQLFQIAALTGFSEKYNCDLKFPPWKYSDYFLFPPTQGNVPTELFIEEPAYNYTPDFWDKYACDFRTKNVDILGWLQSEKNWLNCKKKVRELFHFKEEFENELRKRFAKAFRKETIAISIRRGDFITNPNFYLLPLEYYLGALIRYFPGYKEKNIIIFSDDLPYCKHSIRRLPNVYFADGLNDIEQLCGMSLCDHYIISNSSFSWWGGWLGEKDGTSIVRSPYQLAGDYLKSFNTKDYYPERWNVYDHLQEPIDVNGLLASKSRMKYYEALHVCYKRMKQVKKKIKVKKALKK